MKAFLFVFLLALQAFAEYRVFTLMITNTKTGENKQIDSTLDPIQYISFFPLKTDETIHYTQTWRCKGNTSHFKPHCSQPEKRTPAQETVPEAASEATTP